MSCRHHSGFNIHCSDQIWPDEKDGPERLDSDVIRASFSGQRVLYIPPDKSASGEAKVIHHILERRTDHRGDATHHFTDSDGGVGFHAWRACCVF
jgi:hypothetical protein